MILIMLGVFLLAVFVWLCETALRGDGVARIAAMVESFGLGAVATVGILVAFYVESEWEGPAATFQLFAALFGWGAIWVAFGKTIMRRFRDASIWMTVAAGCFGAWTFYMAQIGDRFGI